MCDAENGSSPNGESPMFLEKPPNGTTQTVWDRQFEHPSEVFITDDGDAYITADNGHGYWLISPDKLAAYKASQAEYDLTIGPITHQG
ncbi:hypothetical protein HY087_01375 [Candidatus Gottesmanbacteria bacterium]|nr:hypothetical protein [Candidatus Gottesmanbacteria bacterium]